MTFLISLQNHCNFLVQTDRGLQCSNGTPCVAFTVPSDVEYKVSVSSGGSRIPLNISKPQSVFCQQHVGRIKWENAYLSCAIISNGF